MKRFGIGAPLSFLLLSTFGVAQAATVEISVGSPSKLPWLIAGMIIFFIIRLAFVASKRKD